MGAGGHGGMGEPLLLPISLSPLQLLPQDIQRVQHLIRDLWRRSDRSLPESDQKILQHMSDPRRLP